MNCMDEWIWVENPVRVIDDQYLVDVLKIDDWWTWIYKSQTSASWRKTFLSTERSAKTLFLEVLQSDPFFQDAWKGMY